MFNIREMKVEDKAVIMPMVITFYHSPAVEHDVDTAVLERTFDAATEPTMPYIHLFIISFFRIYSFLYYILIHIRIIHLFPNIFQ